MKSSPKKNSSQDAHETPAGGRDTKPMPSLVYNQVHFDETSDSNDRPNHRPHHDIDDERLIHQSLNYHRSDSPLLPTNNPPPPRGAWGYVWLAVSLVMVFVIGVWVYSLPGKINLSSWRETGEYKLVRQTQNRWGTNFSSSTEEMLNQIDVSPLAKAIAALNASSTAPLASTTTNISSSTSTTIKISSTTAASLQASTTLKK